MTHQELYKKRESVAQEAYDQYDFGREVAGNSGWEYTIPGDVWIRKVYLEPDDEDADSIEATLTVVFEAGTATLKECYDY